MEHNIGVGAIVGLATASSFYIYKSEKFSSIQKTILLICVIFPPAQWLGILIVLAYNNFIENNSVEKIAEIKNENKINTLNSQVESLKDLKEKGILTNEEYNQKVEKIEAEKAEQDLKNSTEYKQLKSLLDSGVLTKEEFESKIVKINNIINKQLEDKIIDTYNYNVTLINGEILTILNIPKNTNNILGCSVKIHNKNLSGVYISNKYLYEIINDKVVNFYSPKNIKLKDGTICLLYGNFSKPMKGDFIFHTDYSRLNDGKYQLDFFNNIRVKDNRLI
mgnify:CR=1 FL=1